MRNSEFQQDSRLQDSDRGYWRRHGPRFISAFVMAVLIFIPSPDIGPDSSGFSVFVVRLRDLALFVVLTVLLQLVGASLMHLLRTRRELKSLEMAASYIVGQGVIGALLILIGLSGLFTSSVLSVFAVALAGLAPSQGGLARVRSQYRYLSHLIGDVASTQAGKALVVGLGTLMGVLLVITLGPLVAWDGPMYHIDLPFEFLQRGRIFLPDDNLHVAFIAAPQMLLSIPLSLGTTAYLAFSQFVAFALTLVLIGDAVGSWVSLHAGRLATVLVVASTGVVYVSTYDQVDATFVLAVLVALFWVLSADHDSEEIALPFFGLVVGGALLTKYQSIPFLMAVLAVLVWLALTRRVRLSRSRLTLGAALAAATFAPFILKNWILLGAPLYPFLTERVPYPWLSTLGLELPNGMYQGFSTLGKARLPFDLISYIFKPEELTIEAEGNWFGFPFIYILGFGALATIHRRLSLQLLFTGTAAVSLILLVTRTVNLRYFLPIMPMFAVLTAITLASAIPDGSTLVRRVSLFVAIIAALFLTSVWLSQTIIYSGRLQVGMGIESEADWLDRAAMEPEREVRALGQLLTSDEFSGPGRVMLFFEARGYHLGQGIIQDNGQNNWLMLNEAIGDGCPNPEEVSHVVLGLDTLDYLLFKGLDPEDLKWEDWLGFRERCLDEYLRLPGYAVYRVTGK